MNTPDTPNIEDPEFLDDLLSDPLVKRRIRELVLIFLYSYAKGHKSYDKQKAYIATNQWVRRFDDTLVSIYNEVVYPRDRLSEYTKGQNR